MNESENSIKPWYRQFWFWFVVGPLLFIIVMCAFTVSIALKGSDDIVIDNYYKKGRMINQRLAQDERAFSLGLTGEARFQRVSGQVFVTLQSKSVDLSSMPEQLLLFMGHPMKAAQDQLILLNQITPGQYQGDLVAKPHFSWYLTLYATADWSQHNQAEWSLSGEIDFRERDTQLLSPRVNKLASE